jgi:hypothetical protein
MTFSNYDARGYACKSEKILAWFSAYAESTQRYLVKALYMSVRNLGYNTCSNKQKLNKLCSWYSVNDLQTGTDSQFKPGRTASHRLEISYKPSNRKLTTVAHGNAHQKRRKKTRKQRECMKMEESMFDRRPPRTSFLVKADFSIQIHMFSYCRTEVIPSAFPTLRASIHFCVNT